MISVVLVWIHILYSQWIQNSMDDKMFHDCSTQQEPVLSATTNPYFMYKNLSLITISIILFQVFATKAELKVTAAR